jgi:hypothetical protein
LLYGYEADSEHDEPMSLREVTFEFSPGDLRDIAGFLLKAADMIESGEHRHRFQMHWHIDEFVRTWPKRFPKRDIVVLEPNAVGRAKEEM